MQRSKNTVGAAAEVWPPCAKNLMSAAEPCPPGTGFLDAETGPSISPPETTYVRRDQRDLDPLGGGNSVVEPLICIKRVLLDAVAELRSIPVSAGAAK